MIEFIVSIVLLLMIVLSMIQMAELGNAKLRLQNEARTDAGMSALSDAALSQTPRLIETWEPGSDEQLGTADDQPRLSAFSPIGDFIQAGEDWTPAMKTQLPASPAHLTFGGFSSAILGFVRSQRSDTVDIDPFIQDLIYAKPSIVLEEEAWIPALGGML